MALSPSRRDTIGPPPRDVTDLARVVRHQGSYLRSLDPGILDGTRATPRPVPRVPSQLVGDDGTDSGEDILFENGDQVTATSAGRLALNLTYEPIDGSLHIRWNGIDQPPAEWTLDGQLVTFVNSHIKVGDVLTAAYAHYPSDGDVPDAATVTSRGVAPGISAWGTFSNSGGSGPPVPLPAGTQLGDLIVVSAISSGSIAISDPRLTFVGNNMWIGWATSLADIAVSLGSPWYAITVDTFATDASGWTAAQVTSNPSLTVGSTIPTPVVSGVGAAICVATATIFSFGTCAIGAPTDYTNVANTGNPLASSINLWTGTGITTSPAGVLTYTGGGDGAIYATTIGLIGPVD